MLGVGKDPGDESRRLIMTIKTNKAWATNAYEGAFFVTGLIGGYYYTSAVRSNNATDITVTEIHSGMTAGAPFYIMRPSTTFESSYWSPMVFDESRCSIYLVGIGLRGVGGFGDSFMARWTRNLAMRLCVLNAWSAYQTVSSN